MEKHLGKQLKDDFPELSITKIFEYYGGECTDPLADSFVSLCKKKEFSGIIAVGGGKVADL